MSSINLPQPIKTIFDQENSDSKSNDISQLLDRLLTAMTSLLQCDRCYLYIRDPELLIGQILHCYRTGAEIPDVKDDRPHSESLYLAEKDPLFAAALQCEKNIYIDDLTEISDRQDDIIFFQNNYRGQKSLIQAHICSNNELWGILQFSQFKYYRPWTQFDRNLVTTVIDRIAPLVSVYVKTKLRHTIQEFNDGY